MRSEKFVKNIPFNITVAARLTWLETAVMPHQLLTGRPSELRAPSRLSVLFPGPYFPVLVLVPAAIWSTVECLGSYNRPLLLYFLLSQLSKYSSVSFLLPAPPEVWLPALFPNMVGRGGRFSRGHISLMLPTQTSLSARTRLCPHIEVTHFWVLTLGPRLLHCWAPHLISDTWQLEQSLLCLPARPPL